MANCHVRGPLPSWIGELTGLYIRTFLISYHGVFVFHSLSVILSLSFFSLTLFLSLSHNPFPLSISLPIYHYNLIPFSFIFPHFLLSFLHYSPVTSRVASVRLTAQLFERRYPNGDRKIAQPSLPQCEGRASEIRTQQHFLDLKHYNFVFIFILIYFKPCHILFYSFTFCTVLYSTVLYCTVQLFFLNFIRNCFSFFPFPFSFPFPFPFHLFIFPLFLLFLSLG